MSGIRAYLVVCSAALMIACGSSGADGESSVDAARQAIDGSGGSSGCSEENKKVYVIVKGSAQSSNTLFRFDPATLTYTLIGAVDCAKDFIHSMAVDRQGNAWVGMSNGTLYRVSTEDGSCSATGLERGQHTIREYGMAYATLGESDSEKLYITASGSDWSAPEFAYRKLGTINTNTNVIDLIADLEVPFLANMELTGTGDGRLFGMIVDVRDIRNLVVSVAEITPETGVTLSEKVIPLEAKSGFAFAQWGGDFWLFTEAPNGDARVAQYDFENNVIKQTVDIDLGVEGTILGAGVSTCAPIRID